MLNLICFTYGRFGHRKEQCPYRCIANTHGGGNSSQQPVNQSPVKATEDEETFGPWMINRRTNKSRVPKRIEYREGQRGFSGTGNSMRREPSFGQESRYTVIEDMEEETNLTSEGILVKNSAKSAEVKMDMALFVQEKRKALAGNPLHVKEKRKEIGITMGSITKIEYRPKGKENKPPLNGPNKSKALEKTKGEKNQVIRWACWAR